MVDCPYHGVATDGEGDAVLVLVFTLGFLDVGGAAATGEIMDVAKKATIRRERIFFIVLWGIKLNKKPRADAQEVLPEAVISFSVFRPPLAGGGVKISVL